MVVVPNIDSDEWGWFRCWTPHRYALSVEENDIPRDHCILVRDSLVGSSTGSNVAAIVGELYNGDYAELVHGPREGRSSTLSARTADGPSVDAGAVAMAMQLPLLQAMARVERLDGALVQALRNAEAAGSNDKAIKALLAYCQRTVNRQDITMSPDAAVRWWFASLAVSMDEAPAEFRSSHLRDARRMLSAILDRNSIWVSGDWSERLCETARLAVLRLTELNAL
ncbi:hypothetical protein [Microbacterium sp. 179-I 3D3 NHS]|uniref:hypothetical protein n=1 Tax=Microbacterium sp. 179-I 3D3 NHS TaxID=3142382 RepID=UPI00399F47DA